MPPQLRRHRATRLDTLYLLGLILLSTTGQIIFGTFSQAITTTVPLWMAYTSSALLALGAAITLLGSMWRGSNLTALQIEQIGRATLSFPAVGYAAAILYYAQLHAGITSALLIWLGVSCMLRAREIHFGIKAYYEALLGMETDQGDGETV